MLSRLLYCHELATEFVPQLRHFTTIPFHVILRLQTSLEATTLSFHSSIWDQIMKSVFLEARIGINPFEESKIREES